MVEDDDEMAGNADAAAAAAISEMEASLLTRKTCRDAGWKLDARERRRSCCRQQQQQHQLS